MFPVWFLDSPDVCRDNPEPVMFDVKGWIASPVPVENIAFKDRMTAKILPVSTTLRVDVQTAYGMPTTGFEASCRFELVRDHDFLELGFTAGGTPFEIVVPVHSGRVNIDECRENKLGRIEKLLRCPVCGGQQFDRSASRMICSGCGEKYEAKKSRHFNFLTEALRKKFNIVPTDNVSANHYDGVALNMIHRLRNGLILDCGAGYREKYYENVVNYEIVAYDSTDVVGVGEMLPFADNSFDAVFSFAVLEHVKDPFLCARELVRVLKPGGEIYCNVPFLQPLHGYPHHYYNMTRQGMENLFEGLLDIDRTEVLNFGQPVFALSWFLNSYMAGLPEDVRAEFGEMKINDLLKPGSAYMGSPFVTTLADKTADELACCNILLGRKPAGPGGKG